MRLEVLGPLRIDGEVGCCSAWSGCLRIPRSAATGSLVVELDGACRWDPFGDLDDDGCEANPDLPAPLWNWRFAWAPDGSRVVAVRLAGLDRGSWCGMPTPADCCTTTRPAWRTTRCSTTTAPSCWSPAGTAWWSWRPTTGRSSRASRSICRSRAARRCRSSDAPPTAVAARRQGGQPGGTPALVRRREPRARPHHRRRAPARGLPVPGGGRPPPPPAAVEATGQGPAPPSAWTAGGGSPDRAAARVASRSAATASSSLPSVRSSTARCA
jgi:hypothetical protein